MGIGLADLRPAMPPAARRRELADTFTLGLEPLASPLPPGRPGQFNMLCVPGVGEVPISISGDPGEGGPVLHTIRGVGR